MSIKAMTYVWERSNHKGSELLTLLAIADFAHDDGTHAYPSIATLKEKTRMSERSMQAILRKLEASGELEIARNAGPKGCHLFSINMNPGDKIKTGGGAKTAPHLPGGGAESGRGGVQNRVLLQPQTAPNPLLDPSEDPSERENYFASLSSLDGGENSPPSPPPVDNEMVAAPPTSKKRPKTNPWLGRDAWEAKGQEEFFDLVMAQEHLWQSPAFVLDGAWWGAQDTRYDVWLTVERIKTEFAKMTQWALTPGKYRPVSAGGWKTFVNRWLERAYKEDARDQAMLTRVANAKKYQ